MNNRAVTQNRTYNHEKQTNKNTKLHRHWAQGATITPYIYIYIYKNNLYIYNLYIIYIHITSNIIKLLNRETDNKYLTI